MSLVCAQCSRVNPAEAAYCYHDGAALAGRVGGPINSGAAQFLTAFVFPTGQACRNFDQLAITCQQNWTAALDLLKQGFLASFFGGLGRADLAAAAQEAAKFPDPDRGLDQLLAKLPSQVIDPPKLQAEPSEINLGQLKLGTDRTIELHLRNTGMRLLYGSVAADCKWLTLGDAPGQPQKVFQFSEEAVVPVQVRGQYLRAGIRPLEGQLVIDSNGGTVTVTIRADVPVTAFTGGLFDGAVTPRQVAEKAKGVPKDAAPYFEDGRVAAWFQSNGWTYPVQGPAMSGMGAVQQFFEALGVAKPPQVQVKPPSFQLQGKPGTVLALSVEVSSPERKVVYGWATCDKPWVEVGKTKLTGRAAVIPVSVTVPNRAGTQQAMLTVVGNGQQRFDLPITVAVIGGAEILDAQMVDAEPMQAQLVDEPIVATLSTPDITLPETPVSAPTPAVALAPVAVAPPAPPAPPALPPKPPSVPVLNLNERPKPAAALAPTVATIAAPPPVTRPPEPVVAPTGRLSERTISFADDPAALIAAPPLPQTDLDLTAPGSVITRPAFLQAPPRAGLRHRWVHLIPAGLLLVVLMGTCVRDALIYMISPPRPPTDRPLLGLSFGDTMTAGLVYNPEGAKTADPKRLTFGPNGHTNSLVVRIDGKDRVFGKFPDHGRWVIQPKDVGEPPVGKIGIFEFATDQIVVTQEVRLIHGEPIEVSPGVYKPLLDTCLFKYKIENKSKKPHDVGMRFLLDTYIGSNDEVPFTLPGEPGLVDDSRELRAEHVPGFIQVLEFPNLDNPGLIAQLNLRLGGERAGTVYEPPTRIKLTAHPSVQKDDGGLTKYTWEIPLASIKEARDSSVVLYWEPAKLAAGKVREMAFTYGLGSVSIGNQAKLGLTVGGARLVNSELTVVALVADPQPGQKIELQLPPGLTRAEDTPASQDVPPSKDVNKDGRPLPSPVSWRVRAGSVGDFTISVETRIGGETVTQQRRVTINKAQLF
jgi:hypothetical protein